MEFKKFVFVPLFAAFMLVLAVVPGIPNPLTPNIPITIQTMGVILAGFLLGRRLGFMSMLVFLILIALGVKGLVNGRGGFEVFLGPSAGYLISWPICAYLIGWAVEKYEVRSLWKLFGISVVLGTLVMYVLGVPVQSYVSGLSIGDTLKAMVWFIPGDLLKNFIAASIAVGVIRSLNGTIQERLAA